MKMTKVAVLDDNTRDADVIGFAADENEAADVFMAYMASRMEGDDFAELDRPVFAYRIDNAVVAPCFEPLF